MQLTSLRFAPDNTHQKIFEWFYFVRCRLKVGVGITQKTVKNGAQ